MNASSSTFLAVDGHGYERVMGRWSRRLAEPFLDFVGSAAGETVLDLGCGTGSLASALARRCDVGRVLGVDFSAAYVAHASGQYAGDPRLVFQTGDARALDLPDRSFDRVLALLLLHFVPQAERAVAEMRRVARPGAVVGATVWDARGGFVANRLFYDTAAALDPEAGVRRARNYTRPMTRPGELARAWRSAGFADVVDTELHIRMEFESFEDYWAPYEGREGPGAEYFATLDTAQRARLREAVRLAYVDGEADGPRSFAATAWAVKGTVPR